MTGNELDISLKPNPPLNPTEWIGAWMRKTGQENADLKKKIEEMDKKLSDMDEKRKKQVVIMQELAQVLKLKFPDPNKIVEEVKRLTSL